MKTEEYTTIKMNGALVTEIEEFLKTHPEHGTTFEDFIVDAGRARKEQLAATLPPGPATGAQARDEEYSHSNLQAGWDALSKTGPPLTSDEKAHLVRDLLTEFRRLKAANRGAF